VHLVEILLPVADNEGRPFAAHKYADVREELTHRFGGITAFTRAPAQGSIHAKGATVHDDIVVFEVMTDTLNRPWWEAYRHRLEQSFSQDEIVIRAVAITRL
jgi:hypothetical protein